MTLSPQEYRRRFEMILQALEAEIISKQSAIDEVKELDRLLRVVTRH